MDVMDALKCLFVLPAGCKQAKDSPAIMQLASEHCEKYCLKVSWITERQCVKQAFSKTDIVIVQDFSSKIISKLEKSEAVIVGPPCLIHCLQKGIGIPDNGSPIYNTAMIGMQVVASGFDNKTKEDFKKKVSWMGGTYTANLTVATTHLIAAEVSTQKYFEACKRGLAVLTDEWVDAVWNLAGDETLSADDEQFSKYRCPVFHNLVVSCTGISNSCRQNLKEIIESNGGVFSFSMCTSKTKILICSDSATEKKKVAKRYGIPCVTETWVKASVDAGYALPEDDFSPDSAAASTPKKTGPHLQDFNFSALSTIQPDTSTSKIRTIDSTAFLNCTETSSTVCSTRECKNIIDKLDVREAKLAGPFLDGCSIYLVGFNNTHKNKLNKVISAGGATRYDNVTDDITHIIVGDVDCGELKSLALKDLSAAIVSVNWLVDSIKQKHPVSEESYLISIRLSDVKNQLGSPLSKKGLTLLQNSSQSQITVAEEQALENQNDCNEYDVMKPYMQTDTDAEDTLEQYMAKVRWNSKFENLSDKQEAGTSGLSTRKESAFLNGFNCKIRGFSDAETAEMVEIIGQGSGKVVAGTFKGLIDYAILPSIGEYARQTALNIVNNFWLRECHENQCLIIDLEFHHKPLFANKDDSLLAGCVFSTSGYTPYQTEYILLLIDFLGGLRQDVFVRADNAAKKLKASTHLIKADNTSTVKYNGALMWKIPVVHHDWLIECANKGRRVDETPFLIGPENNDLTAPVTETPCGKTKQSKLATVSSTNSKIGSRCAASKSSSSSISTKSTEESAPSNQFSTPPQRGLTASQITPAGKILDDLIERNYITPPAAQSPVFKKFSAIQTPDTPYGKFLGSDPSPATRKMFKRAIDNMPHHPAHSRPPAERRNSTPLSEVFKTTMDIICAKSMANYKRRRMLEDGGGNENDAAQTSTNEEAIDHLEKLQDMLNKRGSEHQQRLSTPRRFSDAKTSGISRINDPEYHSQNAVGWDDVASIDEKAETPRIFMFGGMTVETKEQYSKMVSELGGKCSSAPSYDSAATHLVCVQMARSEKTLCCMAAGKWILHTSYVDASYKANKFLEEEDYEYGNERSVQNIPPPSNDLQKECCASAFYWRKVWKKEKNGPFSDEKYIVCVKAKRESLINIIKAGGGIVLDLTPPFKGEIKADYCVTDVQTAKKIEIFRPLREQNVRCVEQRFVNDILNKPTVVNPSDYCVFSDACD